jgi:hypothetical protein
VIRSIKIRSIFLEATPPPSTALGKLALSVGREQLVENRGRKATIRATTKKRRVRYECGS